VIKEKGGEADKEEEQEEEEDVVILLKDLVSCMYVGFLC
jgi:hypothetical protein